MNIEDKPDPDELLRAVQEEEKKFNLGRLKIYFGMSAGVGKTYAMLQEAHERLREGINVVVGTVNTHGRQETERVLEGLPVIAEKWIEYKDKAFQELDLEKILEIKPELVLVDELAHTNVPGSKHPKRWQDVLEILDAGIDVYTTLNVQHIESRKDIVEAVTGIPVHETVPDLILERATAIEIIDIPPKDLLQRLKEGKVYLAGQSLIAAQNFFKEDNLTALREIALRFTAEKVDHDLHGILALGRGWKTRERLMVAVSPSPSSQQLIRSARRLAFELDAPLVAVFVDTGVKLSPEDQSRLGRNLQFAKELGAEVLTVNDLDIANALQTVARQKNITRLVIGRPAERGIFQRLFFQKSILERLADENKQMDILILRQDRLISLYKQTIPALSSSSPSGNYWIACGTIVIVTCLGWLLAPIIGYKAIGDLFLVGILILSLFVGLGPILLAATLSALSWVYLFITPAYSFAIHDPADIVHVFIYFSTALIVGGLNVRIREKDLFLQRRKEKIEHLYEVMQEIAKSTDFHELRLNVQAKLKRFFEGEFEILIKGGDNQLVFDSPKFILSNETERAAALWSFARGKITGNSTDTFPSVKGVYYPIKYTGKPFGVLAYYSRESEVLSIDEMNFLQTVSDQLATYLDHYVFEERLQSQNYLRQVEKLHNAIFRSVSKGFYKPLDKILSVNQKFKSMAHNEEEKALAGEVEEAGRNLKFIVDNILAISRLESGFISFEKRSHSVKQLIDEVQTEVESIINGHPVNVHLPNEKLAFEFDFNLLKTALKNVMVNALEYSPKGTPIDIIVTEKDEKIVISVHDEGPGIPKEIIPFIFEKFYRLPGASLEGIGLGLTIVKSIVDIHHGKLEVKNRKGKGAEFSMILPK